MISSFAKRRVAYLAGILVAGGVAFWYGVPTVQSKAAAQDAQEDLQADPIKTFMRRKLEHSKAILEGLAVEDFALIQKNAQAMALLSLESNWNRLQTEEYLDKSREFRRAAESIREAANQENLEGAALRYVTLTVQCVECHQYLRRQRPTQP